MTDLKPFSENTYGILKRLRVIDAWLRQTSAERGGERLDVLDFGCGTGAHLLVPLASNPHNFHGVDIHEPTVALAAAKTSRPNLRFSCESTAQLRSKGSRYDVIICSEVLEHLDDPSEHLQDFLAMLKPGGKLFITIPNGYGSYEFLRRVETAMEKVGVEFLIDLLKWPLRAAKWLLQKKGLPSMPGRKKVHNISAEEAADAGYLNVESGHVQFFHLSTLLQLFESSGFEVEVARGKILLCGPYVDFWMTHLARLPLGESIFALNNWLADQLPLRFAADWMFLLSQRRRTC